MRIVRLAGFIVAGLAALAVYFLAGPDDVVRVTAPSIEGIDESIDRALTAYDENATNAGQDLQLQTVINGIAAKDLLNVIASELNVMSDQIEVLSAQTDSIVGASEPDERMPALLLIGVLTIGFHAATLPTGAVASRGTRRTAVPARTPRAQKPDDASEDE
jgi:hypothetical protein